MFFILFNILLNCFLGVYFFLWEYGYVEEIIKIYIIYNFIIAIYLFVKLIGIRNLQQKLRENKELLFQLKYELDISQKEGEKLLEKIKYFNSESSTNITQKIATLFEDYSHKLQFSHSHMGNQSQNNFEILTKRLKEDLNIMYEKFQDIFQKSSEKQNKLQEYFHSISFMNKETREGISELANSLRSPGTKGLWGELQLQTILNISGLQPHINYTLQENICEGKTPDVIINLPNGKKVVIDSKVPLEGYMQYVNSGEDKKNKEYFLGKHIKQLKQHILLLSKKKYWETLENSANFTILFLSGESYLSCALAKDGTLIEYAAENNIVLATPSTLIALLKTISYGWENIKINDDLGKIKNTLLALKNHLNNISEKIGSLKKNLLESLTLSGLIDQEITIYSASINEIQNIQTEKNENIEYLRKNQEYENNIEE